MTEGSNEESAARSKKRITVTNDIRRMNRNNTKDQPLNLPT